MTLEQHLEAAERHLRLAARSRRIGKRKSVMRKVCVKHIERARWSVGCVMCSVQAYEAGGPEWRSMSDSKAPGRPWR